MEWSLFRPVLLALGVGLLVGLERERAGAGMGGIRTFPLIAMVGALCAWLGGEGPWLVAAGLLGLSILFAVANVTHAEEEGRPGIGQTTEMAALVVFLAGAMAIRGEEALTVFLGGVAALLLHWKAPLHGFVRRMGEDDVRALVRLVLLAMVILPIMPDRAYGPHQVLNPFEIWLMVVLIVGISLAAYVAQRLLGARTGTLLAGVLGGLVSSTATTVSSSRRAQEESGQSVASAIIVVIASAVVFARVLFELWVVARGFLAVVAPPLLTLMAVLVALGVGLWWLRRDGLEGPDLERAPKDLRAAVTFGLLYAVILLAVAVVKERFGDAALYGVAAVSGLTDVDAITLSTARMMEAGRIAPSLGWRLVLVGVLSNLAFKAGVVVLLGPRRMARLVLPLFAATGLAGALLLALWPS